MYISHALYLCVCSCWTLFLQVGSLGGVPCCPSKAFLITQHYRSLLLLCLTIAFLPYSFFMAVCQQCLLTNSFPSEKTGLLFFCVSGIFTPELVNLKNTAYSPFWGFWVPVDFHSQFTYTFSLQTWPFKKYIYKIKSNVGCGKGKENSFHCKVSGKTGAVSLAFIALCNALCKSNFSVCWDHAWCILLKKL